MKASRKLTRVKDAELILCLNRGYYFVGIQWFRNEINTTVFLQEGPAKRWEKEKRGRVVVKLQASTHASRRALVEYLKNQNNLEERWHDYEKHQANSHRR